MIYKKIKDIDYSQFMENGKFNITALRTYLAENSIYIKEAVENNELPFQDMSQEERNGIIKFLTWYH